MGPYMGPYMGVHIYSTTGFIVLVGNNQAFILKKATIYIWPNLRACMWARA